ncbi:MAG: DOMON domain-containing protein [Spirochaetales bacterium]|nr:DOMON domain-containing protein [Spirochaetales bacterium]
MKKILLFLVLTFSVISIYAEGSTTLKKGVLSWEESGSNITISYEAPTEGWIAVGLGSPRMDGSTIFIGYSKKGEPFFEQHIGKGHGHRKIDQINYTNSSVTEADGNTKITFTVKKDTFLNADKKQIPVIVAFGTRDSFKSIHRYRDSSVISF